MRLFPDTNVLVAAAATRGLCADLLRLVLSEHELVLSNTVLQEFERVATGRLKLPPQLVQEWLEFFRAEAEVCDGVADVRITTRDRDDDQILAEAITAAAELLVTGDGDLLAVAAESPIVIVTPRGCWERLRGTAR